MQYVTKTIHMKSIRIYYDECDSATCWMQYCFSVTHLSVSVRAVLYLCKHWACALRSLTHTQSMCRQNMYTNKSKPHKNTDACLALPLALVKRLRFVSSFQAVAVTFTSLSCLLSILSLSPSLSSRSAPFDKRKLLWQPQMWDGEKNTDTGEGEIRTFQWTTSHTRPTGAHINSLADTQTKCKQIFISTDWFEHHRFD